MQLGKPLDGAGLRPTDNSGKVVSCFEKANLFALVGQDMVCKTAPGEITIFAMNCLTVCVQ